MSDSNRAVFLSYASEDALAAQRICEALRAAGIEVWFDQSELRGGDAWDRQIRRQVGRCALFVAVISAHSDARTEGYFRREWRMAVERTHDMADDAAFLLPVVIDDTPEPVARVPDKFREVQWSRLAAGATPTAFVERVQRLLATNWAEVPSAGAAAPIARIASGTARLHTGMVSRRGWRPRARLAIVAAIACVAAGLVVAWFLHSKPATHAANSVPSAVQAAPGGPSAVTAQSVAVLPFVNMSADKDQEFFSDGLSEELINLLVKVPELHVAARTSSFYFKGKSVLVADVARALGVANVLEGSVRKSGKTVRVSAQLVRADNGYPIWSATYDRPLDDIFKIQDDIAGSVINGLKVALLGGQAPRAAPTANTEAYTLYLQAASLRYSGGSAADLARSRQLLQRSLKLDPTFAPAWAALAAELAVEGTLFGGIPIQQARVEAHAAIDRALKLDPTLADAHATLGRVLFELDWNWDAAQREVNQAMALEPGNAEFYRLAGYLALIQGRFDVALAMMNKAVALDPLQAWNHLVTGYVTYRMGNLPVAEGSYRKALALSPGSGKFHYVLGSLLVVRGLPAAALAEMQLETDDGFRQCGLPLALDALGRRPEADQALALAEKNFGERKPYLIALVYAARHDVDRSFAWLDRAVRQRDGDLIFIKGEPLVRNLLPDPRYRQLMRTMNLPD